MVKTPSASKAELQARIRAAQAQDKMRAPERAKLTAERKQAEIEAASSPIESDLRDVLYEECDEREMVLSDGRLVRIAPIKMRSIPRWTSFFLQFASLGEIKDGKISDNVELTADKLQKIAVMAPDLGDLFMNLVAPCIDGASPDDIEQDDAFDVIGKFISLNLTAAFMGKVMALAGGVRG